VVVVCGEALIDIIRTGDGAQHAAPGGGPFNTTRALARLGVPAAFLGRLSDDERGRELGRLLVADGASLELASIGHERTTIALAELDSAGGAHYRFDVEGTSAPNLAPAMLQAQLSPDVRAIHVGSLGLVLEPIASTLIEFVEREREGRLVMLDPNVRPGLIPDDVHRARLLKVIALATVVKGSEDDFAWLYPRQAYREVARRLLDLGVRLVVVTQGADGAFGATRDSEVVAKSPRIDVVDTIGAGDAFGAALLAWLHDHDQLKAELRLDHTALQAALDYANLAAAITCSRAGADPPWKGELKPA
jgi:fructokinase